MENVVHTACNVLAILPFGNEKQLLFFLYAKKYPHRSSRDEEKNKIKNFGLKILYLYMLRKTSIIFCKKHSTGYLNRKAF